MFQIFFMTNSTHNLMALNIVTTVSYFNLGCSLGYSYSFTKKGSSYTLVLQYYIPAPLLRCQKDATAPFLTKNLIPLIYCYTVKEYVNNGNFCE